jgi:peptidyl-prolyl cis-trans isomerase-like protein 2
MENIQYSEGKSRQKFLKKLNKFFYRIVGGIETLSAMEAIPTDEKDRPQSDIVVEDTIVFVNPYDEVDAQVIHFFE